MDEQPIDGPPLTQPPHHPADAGRSPRIRSRIVRCLLATAGTFAWLCAAVTIQQGLLLASQSPLLWGVAGLGLLGGIAAWGVAFAVSDSYIEAGVTGIAEFLHRTRASSGIAPDHRSGAALVLFGTLLFAVNTLWVAQHQDTPFDDDQGAFLTTAREIHDHGGLTGLWSDLWSGRFAESNRHPLFLAILSLHPTVDFGRGASWLLATMTAGLALVIVWRRMGPLTAGVLAVLLGTNGTWLYHAPRVVCESLLTGLAGVAWLVLFQKSQEATAALSGHPPSPIPHPPPASPTALRARWPPAGTGLPDQGDRAHVARRHLAGVWRSRGVVPR